MKRKPTVFLATFLVAMGLLLGASTAQAVNVITDNNGNVSRIENLPVVDEFGDTKVHNVDFVYNTAFDIYGTILDFDFTELSTN